MLNEYFELRKAETPTEKAVCIGRFLISYSAFWLTFFIIDDFGRDEIILLGLIFWASTYIYSTAEIAIFPSLLKYARVISLPIFLPFYFAYLLLEAMMKVCVDLLSGALQVFVFVILIAILIGFAGLILFGIKQFM